MSRVILFDVNETVLDTGALDELFREMFGSTETRVTWFERLKELFLVTIATGEYMDFTTLSGDALEMTAERAGIPLEPSRRNELTNAMIRLPAHADVEEALSLLIEDNFRLAALTNGALDAVRNQIDNAGLSRYFDALLSADQVSRYKPAAEPYRMAVDQLGVAPLKPGWSRRTTGTSRAPRQPDSCRRSSNAPGRY